MTNTEFSREFDIKYNNITSNQAPPLNEYEKSVFLTMAERAIVKELFRGGKGGGFELTEEVTAYLATLVKDLCYDTDDAVSYSNLDSSFLSSDSMKVISFALPDELWWIVYESANVTLGDRTSCSNNSKRVAVVPVTHDTLERSLQNPFKQPNSRKVLRLSMGDNDELTSRTRVSNLFYRSGDTFNEYLVRYVRKPKPIILVDLASGDYEGLGLTIDDGTTSETTCELPNSLHDAILSSAVELADAAWKDTGRVSTTE